MLASQVTHVVGVQDLGAAPPRSQPRLTPGWRRAAAGLMLAALVPAAAAQSESSGKTLYTERGCAGCHLGDPGSNVFGIRSGANNPGRILGECATEPTMAPSCGPGAPQQVSAADAADIAAYIANPNSRGPAARATPGAVGFQRAVGNGASPRRTVSLANTTGTPIVLRSVTLQGIGLEADDYVVLEPTAGTPCANGLSLAPQAHCSVDLAFAPAATGTRTVTLLFAPQGFDTVRVPLTGTGTPTAAPAAAADTDTLDFGPQPLNSSSSRTLQISNVGDADLSFDPTRALTLAGPQASDYAVTGGTCAAGSTLRRDGGSCTVEVRFTPKDTLGSRVATLQAGGPGTAATVALQGTGRDADADSAAGCSVVDPSAPFDPLLPSLCATALAVLGWRRRSHRLKHPDSGRHRS